MKLKNYPISIKEHVTLSEYFYSVADEELCRGDDKNTAPIQVYSWREISKWKNTFECLVKIGQQRITRLIASWEVWPTVFKLLKFT